MLQPRSGRCYMGDSSLQYLLSLIDESTFVLDEHGEVQFINDAAVRMFGFNTVKDRRMTFIEVVRDYECDALVKRCIDTGYMQSASISIHGKRQYVEVKVGRDTVSQNYVVIVKDLTEKRHLEEIRRDFMSNVSHEFRTPISSIKLIAETLINGALNDTEVNKDFLHRINNEADKLTHMTDELTELSLMENKGTTLNMNSLNFEGLVRDVVQRLQVQSDNKGLSLICDVEPGLADPVIDQYRIEQVLLNLVYNAIKFTGSGGVITISVKMQENEILVSVSDTGIGIPREELPRVFERFYKVNKARDDGGSGLGLSISKHIIAAHRGRIWVESEEGKGSVFNFTLPLS